LPLGHPSKPIDRQAMIAKFLDCARYAAVPPSAADLHRLIGAIDTLEDAPDAGRALFNPLLQDHS
jgi:hypothetical protein